MPPYVLSCIVYLERTTQNSVILLGNVHIQSFNPWSNKRSIIIKIILLIYGEAQGQKLFIRTSVKVIKCYHSETVLNRSDLNEKQIQETILIFKHKSDLVWIQWHWRSNFIIYIYNIYIYNVVMHIKFRLCDL